MYKAVVDLSSGEWADVSHQPGVVRERGLVPPSEAAHNFDVRHVLVHPGMTTRGHGHAWAQSNYVLSGQGEVLADGRTTQLAPGDFVYFPPQTQHTFINRSDSDPLVMLCIHGAKE